jgi:hypothetical protein
MKVRVYNLMLGRLGCSPSHSSLCSRILQEGGVS